MKKRVGIAIIFLCVLCAVFASENEEISLQARQDALFDGEAYHAFGMALFTYGLCFVATPLGSVVVVILCYVVKSPISTKRLTDAMERYPDENDLQLSTSQYRKTLTPIQRRKNGAAALIGTGLELATIIVGMKILFAGWDG